VFDAHRLGQGFALVAGEVSCLLLIEQLEGEGEVFELLLDFDASDSRLELADVVKRTGKLT